MKLLKPKKFYSIYTVTIFILYIVYFVVLTKVKNVTYHNFQQLPIENQKLNYFIYEEEDAKLYNITLPLIELTKQNVLDRWSSGNGYYQGIKLLLLFPVTLHICYILFTHWSAAFKAHAQFIETCEKKDAHFAYLSVKHKTGLVHEAIKVYLCRVHHYYYNNDYHQDVTFENEKYNIILDGNTLKLQQFYQTVTKSIPDNINQNDGLTTMTHMKLKQNYGENRIVLKYPEFTKIFADEILSPYFAFQVFCSVLYALDNFATYSLFSLSFLLFTQGANVYTKFVSLKQTCKLAPKPIKVNVLRNGVEVEDSSANLVPGDIVVYNKSDDLVIKQEEAKIVEKPVITGPYAQLMNMSMFKIIFKLKDVVFGKYQDEKVYKDLDKVERSDIFPADMLLIEGQLIADESILTGEQASQIKEPIEELVEDSIQQFNQIYSGTKLIQVQTDKAKMVVIRTASQTEQGKLIKTIAFNEERMNITTKDSVLFLFVMFVVACVSALYTFNRGYVNKVCKVSKLFLECLMILVSVIPPDLPTELQLCIGNAVREMRQRKVFSTEPYRILNAGRVKYICFDKSGTLTQSDVKILGIDEKISQESIAEVLKNENKKKVIIKCSDSVKQVVGGCQSLSQYAGKLIGDLLEINAFNSIGGKLDNETVSIDATKFMIVKRFYFNSSIKRMSVIIQKDNQLKLVTKGSPEALQALLRNVPANYKQAVTEYTSKGFRVLSLAYKDISASDIELKRSELECQLTFAGLLVCQTPLKKDTTASIEILKNSGHYIKVISGDHVINAAVSAQQCGIVDQEIAIVEDISNGTIKFTTLKNSEDLLKSEMSNFITKYSICLTGSNPCLQQCIDDPQLSELFIKTTVFARTTPAQKAQIVQKYQLLPQSRTMFVGDGVNDLNALQSADIGVALLEEQTEQQVKAQEQKVPYPSFMEQPGNKPAGYFATAQEAQKRAAQKGTDMQVEMQVMLRETMIYKQWLRLNTANAISNKNDMLSLWTEALDTEEETQAVKMGDATIAAQFTVKSGSLEGVLDIVRQGRCALATVQMNFKTTALQCLVAAYAMTAMTLNGVRSSDSQMIASSLLQTAVVMNISKAKQAKQISQTKPPRTIVGKYLLISTFAQAFIHCAALYIVQKLAGSQMETLAFSTKFQPSHVNTCVFFMRMFLDACVTLVNYPGRPHMEAITQHKKLMLAVVAYVVGVLALLFEVVPELNELLGFVSISNELRLKVIFVGALNFIGCWIIEQTAQKAFA